MNVTLDQARAFEALARGGTYAAAARLLAKQHTAVVYAVNGLEEQVGLPLLDRTGYRTRLTPAGERVLGECRRLLAVERDLETTCHSIRTGWEPRLRLVFDGIFPAARLLAPVARLLEDRAPTRIEVFAEFLSGVEASFQAHDADLMVSVLPPQKALVSATPLGPLRASLLVRAGHPLARRRHRASAEELASHPLLTVRGSDPRLQLSTLGIEQGSTIHLNDFHTKKEALLAGMGLGWMPNYLVERELKRGDLREVVWERTSRHVFHPHAYRRTDRALGRAGLKVVAALAD